MELNNNYVMLYVMVLWLPSIGIE